MRKYSRSFTNSCRLIAMTSLLSLTAFGFASPLMSGQQSSFLSPVVPSWQPDSDGFDALADGTESTLYSQGTQAIQESRWSDAESIFDKVAQRHSDHAEGALYWKAFAENKQGKTEPALKTCADLRKEYPKSRWIDDCGALEIEIRGKSDHPIDPQSEKDENLKLLALNALMHKDESRALPQIQQILAGDQSETFKEQALFVLAQSSSQAAEAMLAQIAHPLADSPENIRSNKALQQRAQQLSSANRDARIETGQNKKSHRVGIDVLVTDAAGKPVPGLNAQDFTVLDNDKPQKILTFHAFDGTKASPAGTRDVPTEVIILIDTVNTSLVDVAYVRDQLALLLRKDGGHFPFPITILFFNGNGAERLAPPSTDGNALAAALEKASANLHPIRRSEAYYGAVERIQLSLGTLGSITTEAARLPGRKMLIWLSPGWPLLAAGDSWATTRQSQTVFDEIVALSTGLRQARISLYSIDPVRSAGEDSLEWFRYQEYRKPVTKETKADIGDLSLQVLSEQSGGRALNYSTEFLSGEIASCLQDAETYYFLSFDAPPASRKDEYHALKITTNKTGLTVHTRSGYYNEP